MKGLVPNVTIDSFTSASIGEYFEITLPSLGFWMLGYVAVVVVVVVV